MYFDTAYGGEKMGKIYDDVISIIGNTPLVSLKKFATENNLESEIIAKLEYLNPGGSVKDRIGFAMIKDGEEKGLINKDTVIIEPTSGNTGIALAFASAALGYKLMIVMPDNFSIERQKLIKAYGAEIILTPGDEGMNGAIKKATELNQSIKNSYIPQQFKNSSNPAVHKRTTAVEIWNDTDGQVDIFVAGVGSGGTLTGVGEFLKEKNSSIRIAAVEPANSPMISEGRAGSHKIQGIGANFVPEILNRDIIDEIVTVTNDEAYETAREIARLQGILVGISSGAAACAAKKLAQRPENKGKKIVVIFPDSGERYISTTLFDI